MEAIVIGVMVVGIFYALGRKGEKGLEQATTQAQAVGNGCTAMAFMTLAVLVGLFVLLSIMNQNVDLFLPKP